MTQTGSTTLLTPRRLLRSLHKNPVILQALLHNVSASQASKSPDEQEAWSILEVLCHLRDYEEHFLQNARLILQEECPQLPMPEESAVLARKEMYQQQDFTAACTAFFATRQAFLQTLNPLSEEQWMRQGIHNGAFPVTLKEIVLQVIMHDIDHIEQITRLLNNPI
jgi:uncharacterized damage-inducible protein DinB